MMDYEWLFSDADVLTELNPGAALTYDGVIQERDTYGGYNTKFTRASGGGYHVHFKAGSTQVNCIRHFSQWGIEGINVVKQNGDSRGSLNKLRREAPANTYPNHRLLLDNFILALENVAITPQQQYANV
jgi:kynurenine formamidase